MMTKHKHGHEHEHEKREPPADADERTGEGPAAGPDARIASWAGQPPVADQPAPAEETQDAGALRQALAEKEQEIEALKKTVAEHGQRIELLHRTAAELDNRRKRLERLMEDHRRHALEVFIADLLPVIDNLGRALGQADSGGDPGAPGLGDGLKLVRDQLLAVLRKHHVEHIEALGQPFDPARHEAAGQVESAEHPDGTVVDVQQEGYKLHERVLRPSRVIISRRPRAAEQGGAQAQPESPKEPPDAEGTF